MAQKGPYKSTPVDSECMSVIGYDQKLKQLDIRFRKSGDVYRYFNFPNNEYDKLMAADSRGRYFVYNIRNDYHFQRLL